MTQTSVSCIQGYTTGEPTVETGEVARLFSYYITKIMGSLTWQW